MNKSHNIHLPRDPFAYIGLWQMLTFVMLLLLIWVNELRDISGFYFGESPDESTLVRGCVLTAAVLFTAIIAVGNTYVQQKRILSTLISVCAKCHRVRVNDNSWQLIEDYISDNSLLSFSHGLCPDCMAETIQDITSMKSDGINAVNSHVDSDSRKTGEHGHGKTASADHPATKPA